MDEIVSAWQVIAENRFEVGGEDILQLPRQEFPLAPEDEDSRRRCDRRLGEFLKERRISFGTILKADNLSVLIGAGASKHVGGILLRTVPLAIERALIAKGIRGSRLAPWLRLFYLAARRVSKTETIPSERNLILERAAAVLAREDEPELQANLEAVLSLLYRWRAALSASSGKRMWLDGEPAVDAAADDLDRLIRETKAALAQCCILPQASSDGGDPLRSHRDLLRKMLTRPLSLKRLSIFTTNYDTLLEQAADGEGVVLLDGFVGISRRVFRPECYDQDLYFPAETTEGRVHRLDRVAHLYKVHGSITWRSGEAGWENPYGVWSSNERGGEEGELLIYPTPAKYGEALGMPYAELLRRFAGAVIRPQSVLIVIGYGLVDEHIVSIVRQAFTIPSFRLIVVDVNPRSQLVQQLRERRDRRVWSIVGPHLGTFTGFVARLLPDLGDEDIERSVAATYRALSRGTVGAPGTE